MNLERMTVDAIRSEAASGVVVPGWRSGLLPEEIDIWEAGYHYAMGHIVRLIDAYSEATR